MNLFRCGLVVIASLWCAWAVAQQPLPVSADIRLSRVAEDTWRVDYVFSQPITALTMDRVGDFRRAAWKPLSPGAQMTADDAAQTDVLSMRGRSFQRLSVEIRSFSELVPKQYLAVDRFSDGGRLFFLGFLAGKVNAGSGAQPLVTYVTLAGRPGETTLAPPRSRVGSTDAYAYFGPQQPTPAGTASAIFDPATPQWVKEAMLDATAKVSDYYARAYGRAPEPRLVMMVTMGDTSPPGMSMKGGAVGSQIAYTLSGKQFLTDHPLRRDFIAQLVAHEIAHVWQQQVAHGGIGGDMPWVHEGGAEAMAYDAMMKTGIWNAAAGDAFMARVTKRCADAGNSLASYEGMYACGFKRFQATGIDAALLWQAMMRLSEQTAQAYSPQMLERAASELRAGIGGAIPPN